MPKTPENWWDTRGTSIKPIGFTRRRNPITKRIELVPFPLEMAALRLIRILHRRGRTYGSIATTIENCMRKRGRKDRKWSEKTIRAAIMDPQPADDVLAMLRSREQ